MSYWMKVSRIGLIVVAWAFVSWMTVGHSEVQGKTVPISTKEAGFSKSYLKGEKHFAVSVDVSDFAQAPQQNSFLEFKLQSTKMALFTSEVTGYLKKFSLDAHLKNGIFTDAVMEIDPTKMDTDSDGRNKKMWSHCLSVEKYSRITAKLKEPIALKADEQVVVFLVEIRGAQQEIPAQVKFQEVEGKLEMTLTAQSALSALKIPPPINPVASLADEIKINGKFVAE